MATRYSYESKTFQTGRQKGKEYVNVRSVKTGRLIKTVSSKKNLQRIHKNIQQREYRQIEKDVESEIKYIAGVTQGNIGDLRERYKKDLVKAVRLDKIRVQKGRIAGKKSRPAKRSTLRKSVLTYMEKHTGYVTTFRFGVAIVQVSPAGIEQTPKVIARGSGTFEGFEMDRAIKYVNNELRRAIGIPDKIKGKRRNMNWLWNEDTRAIADFDMHPQSGICIKVIDRETGKRVGRTYARGAGCSWDTSGSD